MAKTNDQILLDAIIAEQRVVWGTAIKEDKLFELFSADQILKNQNMDAAEIQAGNIGQGLDGQIDSFYIFADGEVVEKAFQTDRQDRSDQGSCREQLEYELDGYVLFLRATGQLAGSEPSP